MVSISAFQLESGHQPILYDLQRVADLDSEQKCKIDKAKVQKWLPNVVLPILQSTSNDHLNGTKELVSIQQERQRFELQDQLQD